MQLRYDAHAHALSQFVTQEPCRMLQDFQRFGRLCFVTQHGNMHTRMRQVTRHRHPGHADHAAQARILQLGADQVSQLTLDLLANAPGTGKFSGHDLSTVTGRVMQLDTPGPGQYVYPATGCGLPRHARTPRSGHPP
jgi:hypothetical protein